MCFNFQSDDPAVKWQLNLYKDVLRNEEPSNPEKTVERVQRISAALFHLEQVWVLTLREYKQDCPGGQKLPPCPQLSVIGDDLRQKAATGGDPPSPLNVAWSLIDVAPSAFPCVPHNFLV